MRCLIFQSFFEKDLNTFEDVLIVLFHWPPEFPDSALPRFPPVLTIYVQIRLHFLLL